MALALQATVWRHCCLMQQQSGAIVTYEIWCKCFLCLCCIDSVEVVLVVLVSCQLCQCCADAVNIVSMLLVLIELTMSVLW